MKLSPRPPRTPARLSDSVCRRLNMYALASSATGLGLLCLNQSAEAKIIYTKAKIAITVGDAPVSLDLNNDGIPDFKFFNEGARNQYGTSYSYVSVYPAQPNNEVRQTMSNGHPFAAALNCGVRVASKNLAARKLDLARSTRNTYTHRYVSSGPWLHVKQRYLGLKFAINGRTHYAWARINWAGLGKTEYIVGYAYETIPNKPIITGRTKGPDVITVPADKQPATLGRLALGRK